jgi:hypothetical protein
MRPQLLEHVGFLNVFTKDPGIVFSFEHATRGPLGVFGCYLCTEQEMFDFSLFRAAILCGCGRMDSILGDVTVAVEYEQETYRLIYDDNERKFGYGSEMH